MVQWEILWSDALIYLLFFMALVLGFYISRKEHLRLPWSAVLRKKTGICSLIVLLFFISIGLLDSIHLKHGSETDSVFDLIIQPIGKNVETTYSKPFSLYSFSKESFMDAEGKVARKYSRLKYSAPYLKNEDKKIFDILYHATRGMNKGISIWLVISILIVFYAAKKNNASFFAYSFHVLTGKTPIPWRSALAPLQ